jgi:hypothetical protein
VSSRIALPAQDAARPVQALGVLTAVGVTGLVVLISMMRFVDGDEGFYALAGVLVLDGELLYEDFFFTQMPLLPYVFGAWFWAFGESWYALRALAALLTLATALILYLHVRRATASPRFALLALALYGLSSFIVGWFTIGKTYALSTGLLLAGYALVAPPERGRRAAAWAACGLLLGLAVDTRLLFAAAAVPLLAAAARGPLRAALRTRVAPFLAGLGIGLLPSFVYFLVTPKAFVFDNLGFHSVRSSGGLIGNFDQKLDAALNLLSDVQFVMLVGAAVTVGVLGRRQGRPVSLALWIALVLGIASALPTPTWTQYFAVVVPFLIAGCLETAPALAASRLENGLARGGAAVVLAVAATLYVVLAAVGIHRYAVSAEGIPHEPPAASWKIEEIRRVSAAIDDLSESGEEVLALWPGYLFGTHASVVPGLETRSSFVAAAHVSPQDEARYHVVSTAEVVDMLRAHRTRLFVIGHHDRSTGRGSWSEAARRSGYRKIASFRGTRIFLWEGGA